MYFVDVESAWIGCLKIEQNVSIISFLTPLKIRLLSNRMHCFFKKRLKRAYSLLETAILAKLKAHASLLQVCSVML